MPFSLSEERAQVDQPWRRRGRNANTNQRGTRMRHYDVSAARRIFDDLP
jgi:hypothetical protein